MMACRKILIHNVRRNYPPSRAPNITKHPPSISWESFSLLRAGDRLIRCVDPAFHRFLPSHALENYIEYLASDPRLLNLKFSICFRLTLLLQFNCSAPTAELFPNWAAR